MSSIIADHLCSAEPGAGARGLSAWILLKAVVGRQLGNPGELGHA